MRKEVLPNSPLEALTSGEPLPFLEVPSDLEYGWQWDNYKDYILDKFIAGDPIIHTDAFKKKHGLASGDYDILTLLFSEMDLMGSGFPLEDDYTWLIEALKDAGYYYYADYLFSIQLELRQKEFAK